jgi:tetratricopeptide (TPR) repeat protein
MKIWAVPILFLVGGILAPRMWASQGGAARPRGSAPALDPAAAQRQADEDLARTYMITKRYVEAEKLYERLAKDNPRDPKYLNLAGIASMQAGDLRGARKWFERCVKLEPRFADAYNNLGATYYSEKNFKRALQYYQRAVALQPGVAGYHTNVGYAYFSMKLVPDAYQAFRRALLMDPFVFQQNDRTGSVVQDRSVKEKGLFAFTLAKSYASTGDAQHCAAYLRRALDEGFEKMANVYSDPDFAGVLEDPEVQEILTLLPAPGGQAAVSPSP